MRKKSTLDLSNC